MIATECPFCHVKTAFEVLKTYELPPFFARQVTAPRRRDTDPTYEVVRCINEDCGMVVSLIVGPDRKIWQRYPALVVGKTFPDVPEHIASAAGEAYECLGAGASRGAVALARAVIEATAKERKIVDGNLWSKIEKLAERGLIPESARLAAHEVRFAGNDVAHGDLVDHPMEVEDAVTILELMSIMLASVYQEPAKILRVQQSRLARSVKAEEEAGSPSGASA